MKMLQYLLDQLKTRNDIQDFLNNAGEDDTIHFEFDGTSFEYTKDDIIEALYALEWTLTTFSNDL